MFNLASSKLHKTNGIKLKILPVAVVLKYFGSFPA